MMMRGYRNYHIAKWLLVVILLTTTLILPACASPTTSPTTTLTSVTFPDPSLETVIRKAIYKPAGPIYTSDLRSLTYLRPFNISDLTGLEYCLNLQILDLSTNNISDISPLVGLINLEWLDLGNNNISDISVLAGLSNLGSLVLWDNNISDISALVDNVGLLDGDTVYLMDNPLSTESINVYIPQLEARDVTVSY